MPFGITNAPSTFMILMNEVLKEYTQNFVILYLVDILIFSQKREEHLRHLKMVLKTMQKEKVLVNLKKCSFLKKELIYLGSIILEEGLKMDQHNLQAMSSFPLPRSAYEVRRSHVLARFNRKFI